jgi:hypothetical protein
VLEIPVTNTGEVAARFTLNVGTPAGWQAKPTTGIWIETGITVLVPVEVRPYIQSAIGSYQLDLTAVAVLDPAVTSDAPLRVGQRALRIKASDLMTVLEPVDVGGDGDSLGERG